MVGLYYLLTVFLIPFFLHIFCLPFGSKASFFETRLAFFWATIVYSPILLSLSIIEVIFYNIWISWFLNFFSIFCYAWIFTSIFGRAHKFLSNLYIFFTKNEGVTWTQHTKLLPPVSINNGYFGCSVDLIEGIAIVGSYGDNSNGLKSGSAHIYLNSGMSNPEGWFVAHSLYPDMYGESINHCPEDKYNNTDYVNNYFGFSVNITENYAVVGAPSERKGSAYIFYSSTLWANYSEDKRILVKKLENTRLNRFGFSVTADGTKILIGAPGRDGVGGSSTLFSVDPYVLNPQMTLSIPDNISLSGKEFNTQCLSARSLFGRSTSLLGNTILVSGHGRTCENKHVGSAFLYTSNTSLVDSSVTIEPITCLRDKVSKELFGHDVDISAEYVVIGDPSHEMVHVYDLITLKANQKLKRWLASDQKLLASDFFSYSINIHE